MWTDVWFWIALVLFPFALIGGWYLVFMYRSRKGIQLILDMQRQREAQRKGNVPGVM